MAEMGTAVETAEIGEGKAIEKEVTEKEVSAKEGEVEKSPEQVEKDAAKAAEADEKEKARIGYEKRQKEKKRLHDLEIENAELRGFKKAMEKGGKTEGKYTADASAAIESEFSRTDPEPDENDAKFKSWAEYNKAHTLWAVRLAKFVDSKTEVSKVQESATGEMRKAISAQKEKGETEFADFGEVIADLSITSVMLEEIYDSPEGHKIAYYLGMNQKEQDRIASLPAKAQIKEIAKIESKIESGAIQLKKPISKAPEPAPKPGSKGAAADSDEARYADPKTSTKDRIEISQRLRRAQGK